MFPKSLQQLLTRQIKNLITKIIAADFSAAIIFVKRKFHILCRCNREGTPMGVPSIRNGIIFRCYAIFSIFADL